MIGVVIDVVIGAAILMITIMLPNRVRGPVVECSFVRGRSGFDTRSSHTKDFKKNGTCHFPA